MFRAATLFAVFKERKSPSTDGEPSGAGNPVFGILRAALSYIYIYFFILFTHKVFEKITFVISVPYTYVEILYIMETHSYNKLC